MLLRERALLFCMFCPSSYLCRLDILEAVRLCFGKRCLVLCCGCCGFLCEDTYTLFSVVITYGDSRLSVVTFAAVMTSSTFLLCWSNQ